VFKHTFSEYNKNIIINIFLKLLFRSDSFFPFSKHILNLGVTYKIATNNTSSLIRGCFKPISKTKARYFANMITFDENMRHVASSVDAVKEKITHGL